MVGGTATIIDALGVDTPGTKALVQRLLLGVTLSVDFEGVIYAALYIDTSVLRWVLSILFTFEV